MLRLAARLDLWPQRLAALHQQHRRAIHSSVVVALVGFSAVAFGVAPLAPDAADLPQRVLVEELPLTGLDAQLEALAEPAPRSDRAPRAARPSRQDGASRHR
jgi:hypothetical protein